MHDSTRDGRVRDRIKAVLLASVMISQALRSHETTVVRHINDYLQSEKLKPENGGSQSRLSAVQDMRLIEHLAERTYFHTHQIVACGSRVRYSLPRYWYEQVATSPWIFIQETKRCATQVLPRETAGFS